MRGEYAAIHQLHPVAGKIPAVTKSLLLCPPQSGTLAFCFSREQRSAILPFKLSGAGLPLHQYKERASPALLCLAAVQASFPCLLHRFQGRQKKYTCLNANLGDLVIPQGPLPFPTQHAHCQESLAGVRLVASKKLESSCAVMIAFAGANKWHLFKNCYRPKIFFPDCLFVPSSGFVLCFQQACNYREL